MKNQTRVILFLLVALTVVALAAGYARSPTHLGTAHYKDAKLPPYTPPVVYHHNHVMMLGKAVSPSRALPRYLKYKEALLVPPRTQGICASCWAFAIADMVADRVSLLTRGRVREHLSPQEMLSCLRPRWFPCDQGGIPEIALRYPMIRGLLTEKAYPYENELSTDIGPCRAGSKLGLLEMIFLRSSKRTVVSIVMKWRLILQTGAIEKPLLLALGRAAPTLSLSLLTACGGAVPVESIKL